MLRHQGQYTSSAPPILDVSRCSELVPSSYDLSLPGSLYGLKNYKSISSAGERLPYRFGIISHVFFFWYKCTSFFVAQFFEMLQLIDIALNFRDIFVFSSRHHLGYLQTDDIDLELYLNKSNETGFISFKYENLIPYIHLEQNTLIIYGSGMFQQHIKIILYRLFFILLHSHG